MYFYSDNSADLGQGTNSHWVCPHPGVSDLMSNFITARSTSPLSDPYGREARVTSAFESPLSDLNGREASLIAEPKSPLSDLNGREASLIAEPKRPLSDPNGREASLIAESKNPLSVNHSSHCREVSVMAATQCFQINVNMSKTEITKKDENKNKNNVKIKKDSMGITKIQKKIIKDCIAIINTNEKIKKGSIGIIKINKKIKKDSVGITKTDEKIRKDSVGITKTHQKIIKSKKYVKKNKIKNQSMALIAREEFIKNPKSIQKTKKDNIKNQKQNKINICPKKKKYFKIDKKKRTNPKTKRDRVRKMIISKPSDNLDNNVLTVEGVLEDIMKQNGQHLWEKQLLEIFNQYDDKNNRDRICAYRKAMVRLQDRLRNGDDTHKIKTILKKILISYKKKLEIALDTLTSTPPSSDDEDAENESTNCFNLLSNRPPAVYEVVRKVDDTHSVDTTENNTKNKKADSSTFVEDKASYKNIKDRKIIITHQKNNKQNKKITNKKLTRSTPKKAKIKHPLNKAIPKSKHDMPPRKLSKTTKIDHIKQFNKNDSLIKKQEKEEFMTDINISNIDCVVQSWRYPMCVTCAIKCNATYYHDLYLASRNCQNKCHLISNRSSILKGYGKYKAAVEFINATRKLHTEEIFEARYYAQNAIQTSNKYDDNLNVCVKKLAMNILDKISTGEYNDKSLSYFTITELIVLSNKNWDFRNIKKKMCQSSKLKYNNSNQSLDTFDKKNNLKFENALIHKEPNIKILNSVKNQPMVKKIFEKKNNLLLGGSRKKRTKRINYNNLAGNEDTENIYTGTINNTNNNDEDWKPELTSDVSDDGSDVSDDKRVRKKRKKGYHTKPHKKHIRKTGYKTEQHKKHIRKTGYKTEPHKKHKKHKMHKKHKNHKKHKKHVRKKIDKCKMCKLTRDKCLCKEITSVDQQVLS